MKKVGIVGGMGPESTVVYYHDIVYGVQQKYNKEFFPRMTIESVDVFTVLELCSKQKYQDLFLYLLDAVNNLCKCDVDFIVLAANTPHIVYDKLVEAVSIPIISIVEETAIEAEKRGLKRLGLLGTKFTMSEEYYKRPFELRKIDIVTPDVDDMNYVAEKIEKELEHGIIRDETRHQLCKIIEKLQREKDIDGVILGCTELPLIISSVNCPVSCLDTMNIHITSIIRNMLV